MDEEAMWKGIYDKLQEIKSQPPTEHDQQYVFVQLKIIFFVVRQYDLYIDFYPVACVYGMLFLLNAADNSAFYFFP